MYLKRERPQTDDFAIKKISRFNFSKRNAKFFTSVSRHLYKKFLKISLHILPKFFNFFPTKTYIFIGEKGFAPPPPLTDMSAKHVIFFWTAPLINS